MNTIKLKPKYEKIRKDLIRNNEDSLHRDSAINNFIKLNAQMIAQGLQLSEECSDEQSN